MGLWGCCVCVQDRPVHEYEHHPWQLGQLCECIPPCDVWRHLLTRFERAEAGSTSINRPLASFPRRCMATRPALEALGTVSKDRCASIKPATPRDTSTPSRYTPAATEMLTSWPLPHVPRSAQQGATKTSKFHSAKRAPWAATSPTPPRLRRSTTRLRTAQIALRAGIAP